MASVLCRAAKLSSPITARSLLRASRSGIILPRYAVQSTPLRFASAAAAAVSRVERSDAQSAPFESSPESSSQELDHSAIEDDQPAFSTLEGKVSAATLKALTVSPMQLKNMSPVQTAVLPLLPDLMTPPSQEPGAPTAIPRDLMVKARTGTGKTIAFLVPAIEGRLAEIKRFGQTARRDSGMDSKFEIRAQRTFARDQAGCVIISPTRELATQIAVEATKLCKHHLELQVHLLVGGASKRDQMRHWNSRTRDIVIATPGRLRDLLENEPDVAGPISKAKLLVLDEADTLLEMGFREDIDAIANSMPKAPERQTFLFSATVSRAIQQVARATLSKNHEFINCVSDDAPPVHAHVPQYHTVLQSGEDQIPHILRLIAHDQLVNPDRSKILLFLPTTKMTQLFGTILRELQGQLPNPRTRIYEIHSKRTQQHRTRMSDEFRAEKSGASVLVSSDVSARGVDYPNVSRVIQVGVPATTEQYVHRVGRTGRGLEKHGRADLVLLPWELGFVTWQLTDIPLKALSTGELSREVASLIEKHDSQPRKRMSRFQHPYGPTHEGWSDEIKKLQENLDPDAIKETMSSLIGYYVGRAGDLRCQKSVIVAGLKDWSMEAGGLPEPPFISDAFLAKMGAYDAKRDPRREPRNYKRHSPNSSSSRPNFSASPAWLRNDGGRSRERQSGKPDAWFLRGSDRSSRY